MKKKLKRSQFPDFVGGLSKLTCIMKLTLILILLNVCVAFSSTYSQQTKFTLSGQNVSIRDVLSNVESKSEFRFFFNGELINLNQRVNYNIEEGTISQLLDQVLLQNGIQYEVKDRTIILSPKPSNEPGIADQQQRSVSGVVTDASGAALPGVSVVIKGTVQGAITGVNGSYTLTNVSPNAILIFSFVGMKTQEIAVAGKTSINIQMEEETVGIEEVVAIGYGTQKKANITGAVSSVKVDEVFRNIPTTDLTSLLSGKMSGVNITSQTGVPGVTSSLNIRAKSSFNDSPPLYVIDGTVRNKEAFDLLNANEIEDITILKDAASAAIYGSQSSGGVVLIKTKRGQSQQPEFHYSASYAVEKRTQVPELMNAVDGAYFTNSLHPNDPSFFYYWDQDEIDYIKTINNGYGADNLKDIWVDPNTMQHSLDVSGGSEKVKYFAGGSYVDQNGFMENLTYKKYDMRVNLTVEATKNITLFAQLATASSKRNRISFEEVFDVSNLYSKLLVWQPDWRLYTTDGQPIDYGWLGNIGEFSKGKSGYNVDNIQSDDIQVSAEYRIPFIKGLKIKGQYSHNYRELRNKIFLQKQNLVTIERQGAHQHIWTDNVTGTIKSNYPDRPMLQQSSDEAKSYQLNFQMNYDRSFGSHNLSALFVYEQSESSSNNFHGGRETFPVLVMDQFFAASGARADTWSGGGEFESGRLSYIGQLMYNYKEKYFINTSLRADGSSKFSSAEQWGYFPAVSMGWIVSNESFFKNSVIDFFKLRASRALTGNDNVVGWQWLETFSPSTSAYFGNPPAVYPGIRLDRITNPDITWEKTREYNLGMDVTFLKKMHFNADYWSKHTYDILGSRIQAVPTTFGYTLPSENYAVINAHGFDFEFGYKNKIKDLSYFVNVTFSYGTNIVKKMDFPVNGNEFDNPNGKPLGIIVGYEYDKIIRTQEDLDALPEGFHVFGATPELGMMIYKDIGGIDGKPDGYIDGYDKALLSKRSIAPVSFGLNPGITWKSVSLDMMFAGKAGNKKRPDGMVGWYEWNRVPSLWLNSWSTENPDAKYPKAVREGGVRTYNVDTDFWLEDASFVRLKYLTASYALPVRLVSKMGLSSVKFVFSGTNLFTLSKFKYFDPEINQMGSYPNMKTYNLGLDIIF